jgi:hypothetical protein
MTYAKAVRDGDCDEVIRMTWWMMERLQRIESGTIPGSPEEAQAQLCSQLRDRRKEGNHILREGVEDQYVFSPGATLEPVDVDAGRSYLAKPVQDRTWIRVTYVAPDQTLLDKTGRPIRSIVVGINVSKDGYVLKAGVVGNLDIDHDAIYSDWQEAQGG